MPTASTPTATAGYTDIIARTISARFNTRPTLRSATASLLKEALLEKYPPLDFDPERTRLAQPLPEGGWRLTLLLDVVLAYLATGTSPVLREQYGRACFLTNKAPTHLTLDSTTSREPDMQVIAGIIRELPSIVFVAFQQALSDYWDGPVEAGASRWQWLGDLLNGVLKTSAVRLSSLNPLHAEILIELSQHPDKQQRLEAPWSKGTIQACFVKTTLGTGEHSISLQSPDILVICAETVLLCSVTGGIESFPSLDAFGQAWAARFEQAFKADAITWKRYEPDGNIFDTQAALLLNQQLEDLAALKLPAGQRQEELEKRYEAITDVAALFIGHQPPNSVVLQRIASNLPDWLQTADAVDRMTYRTQVLELASIKQQTGGRTFLDGLDDLHAFAKKALHKQMLADQPLAPGYDADQLELTFHVPVGDLGSGYLEPVKMSLTEFAIKNLAGKPKGRMTIRHTADQLIQDWTTEAYLLDLIARVNVGKHYPEFIRTELLADTAEARERGRLFGLELTIRLPMLALEQAIKAEQGFSRQGYRYVAALMHKTGAERFVDEQEIVLRPLAFQRKAEAECDVAGNMFIIEPRDPKADGPHILYQPLYSPALRQYPTRQALLNAIAQSGLLQSSVLTWLPERARPIYANNGFNEPHIVHMQVGDEFSRPEKPGPAILVGDEAAQEWLAALKKGQLMTRLFESNAQALVKLADQQSVSNAESRWAIILEGSWLLFNNLVLPLLRGPAMLVGWMLQLTHSLTQDLPALDSDNATAREQAWVDVLLNLGLILLHVAQNRGAIDEQHLKELPVTLGPLRRALAQTHASAEIAVTQATPGLPSEPPGSGHTLLDFNLSTARDSASARLFGKLYAVRVPWPSSLPEPVAIGAFKGLYRISDTWHVTLAGLLFRVQIVPGLGEVFIVHPERPDHPGIKLKTDGHGKWSLDQGLKLVGGGPKKRIAAVREQRQQRIAELNLSHQAFTGQQAQIQKRVDIAEQLMLLKDKATTSTPQERAAFRQRYVEELDKQTETYVTLMAEHHELCALTDIAIDYALLSDMLENIINNVRKRIVIADYDRSAVNLNYKEYSGNAQQIYEALSAEGDAVVDRYFDFMRQTGAINETMIKSYEEIDSQLEELKRIPLLGARAWQRLTSDRSANELTALRVKAYHLLILRTLSVKALGTEVMNALGTVIEPLMMLSRSHAELQGNHAYQRSDRIAVLDNLVDHYGQAQDALESIGIFNAEELQMPAFNRLRELIDQLRIDAEQRLAKDIQQAPPTDEDAPTTSATAKDTSTTSATSTTEKGTSASKSPASTRKKKVIKTAKGSMIGEVRPPTDGETGEIVDILGPLDDKPVASFHEHTGEPNVWVEMVEARPTPPKASTGTYDQIKGNARKAMTQVDGQVLKIEGYVKRASSPKEIEEQLQREAQKLAGFADDLQRHIPLHSDKDSTLVANLRDKAKTLEQKATDLRIKMTLDRPPTSEGVQYLLQRNQLSVRMLGTRVQLKTGRKDLMQEYALLRPGNNTPWWYAHFHYAALTDAKTAYTVAHLKTEAQRFETYESTLAKTQDPKSIIGIHRGVISKVLADTVFLPQEPR